MDAQVWWSMFNVVGSMSVGLVSILMDVQSTADNQAETTGGDTHHGEELTNLQRVNESTTPHDSYRSLQPLCPGTAGAS